MNYYEILEVSVNASKEVIKNAYRALTKKYHPDSYKGDPEYAQEKMKEINEAYETLMDDNKRLIYDYDNGFKIDPNAPKEETEIIEKEEEKANNTKENENKEDKIKLLLKNKKIIIIGVIILFIVAFMIGILLAGSGDDKKEDEDEVVVEEDVDEQENTTNNTNTYRPNNNVPQRQEPEEVYTPEPKPNVNDTQEEEDIDENIKEPDGIS